MVGRLARKTCLVTGAAQGIGRAIVATFAREGATVIAADRQAIAPGALGADVEPAKVDVTCTEEVDALARRFPEVSVLVNCAGWVATGSVSDCSDDELARSFQVNVASMHRVIRAFLPAMIKRGEGSIVNIASVVSSVKGAPARFAYGTTKAAVIGLTKSVARDTIASGVRCNAISPGTVMTPSLEERISAQGDKAAARAAFIARQPMGRLGEAEEIANVAVLLASDEARFMSGGNIVIDGGMSL